MWTWIYATVGVSIIWPIVVQYWGDITTMKNDQHLAATIDGNTSMLLRKIRALEQRMEEQDRINVDLQNRSQSSSRATY